MHGDLSHVTSKYPQMLFLCWAIFITQVINRWTLCVFVLSHSTVCLYCPTRLCVCTVPLDCVFVLSHSTVFSFYKWVHVVIISLFCDFKCPRPRLQADLTHLQQCVPFYSHCAYKPVYMYPYPSVPCAEHIPCTMYPRASLILLTVFTLAMNLYTFRSIKVFIQHVK